MRTLARALLVLCLIFVSVATADPLCPANCVCTMTCQTTTTTSSTSSTSSTASSTTTTVRVTTTTTLASGCSAAAVRLTGLQAHRLSKTVPPNIDATEAIWTGMTWDGSRYPIVLSGNGCFTGGSVFGTYDRNLSWQTMHDMNHAGIALKGPVRVDGVRLDDLEDGIRPQKGADGFAILGSHFSYLRDDLLEDDWSAGGLFEDNLNEGSYVQFSCRNSSPVDNHTAVLTIRNNLLHCQPMPGPTREKRDPGTGACVFKWQTGYCPAVVFEDNVVFAEQQTDSEGGVGISDRVALASCKRNVLVYTGTEPLNAARLRKDPVTGEPCFTVVRDRAAWDGRVIDWKASHYGGR